MVVSLAELFFGCIMYADALLLLTPSVNGMQSMLDICSAYGGLHDIVFNGAKTVIMSVDRNIVYKPFCLLLNTKLLGSIIVNILVYRFLLVLILSLMCCQFNESFMVP